MIQLIYLMVFLLSVRSGAQSLVEDASSVISSSSDTFNETIKIISSSKKIFVLTNNSQQLNTGDFISLALDNQLAARALVGKTHEGQAGIKILKIYSLNQWGKLRRNLDVQIIKGDDSYFNKKKDTTAPETAKIKSEEDLYTGDVVDEDISVFDENKKRHIKPDNVVALSGSYFDAKEPDNISGDSGTVRGTEVGFSWAYQFTDNFFAEVFYGRTNLKKFPQESISTQVNNWIGRIKFNIKGPLYTFFMPYVGYQSVIAKSPEAGKSGNDITDERELQAIDKVQKSGPVFGVTIMRRLVPGWFIKADVGTDIINAGFAVEF